MRNDKNIHTLRLYSTSALSPALSQNLKNFVELLARIAAKSDYCKIIKEKESLAKE